MMNIVRIDKKFVAFMLISLSANYVKYTETTVQSTNKPAKPIQSDNHKNDNVNGQHDSSKTFDLSTCSIAQSKCSDLPFDCIDCKFDFTHKSNGSQCDYGDNKIVDCWPKNQVQCFDEIGTIQSSFTRSFMCRSCFLSDPFEYDCEPFKNCSSSSSNIVVECRMKPQVLCIGNRKFNKKVQCNWTRGAKKYTALILSITLGGFGIDRFYLGHWQEGIGKLFSFGGLGVWVLVDSILISVGFLGTSDGSRLI